MVLSKSVRARVLVIVLGVVLTAVVWGSSPATAQESKSDFLWVHEIGTTYEDQASAVAIDATGVYVAGDTGGTLPGQTSGGSTRDAFLRKYDRSGNVLWTNQFAFIPSTAALAWETRALALAADATGAYVAGFTDTIGDAAGTRDAFLRKYDPSGSVLWTSQFAFSNLTSALALAAGPTGVYVAGVTGTAGDIYAPKDVFLRKYDPNGKVLWTTQFGTSFDGLIALAADPSGAYVAGGGTLSGQTSAGWDDAFLRKYDPSGNVLWTSQFGTWRYDAAFDVAVDSSGVYAAGFTGINGFWDPGCYDPFLRKYDASGNVIWTRKFGTSNSDCPVAVAVNASGVYVAGETSDALVSPNDWLDTLLAKYDTTGNVTWTQKFGTSEPDRSSAVAVDANVVYVAGETWGTFPGEASGGWGDAFLAALVAGPALALALTSPADGTTVREGTILVAGTTEVGAHLVVNGLVVAVSPSGSFSLSLALKEGTNVITATATNSTGYSTTVYRTVTYENPLPGLEKELQETREELAALGVEAVVGLVAIAASLSTLQYLLLRRSRGRGGEELASGGSATTGPPVNVSVPVPLQPPPSLEGSNSRSTRRAPAGHAPNRTIRLTTKERILLHLARYVHPAEAAEAPPALTQDGVAAATWIEPRHLAQYVDPLVRDGLLSVRTTHVQDGSQRRRVYELTDKGTRVAARLLARAESEVVPVWDGEHIWDIRVGDIMEKMNHKLSVLELARHLAEAGVVDFAALGSDREDTSAEAGNSKLGEPSDGTTREG